MEMERKMKLEMRRKVTRSVRRALCLFLIRSLSLIPYLIFIEGGITEISVISELRANQKPLLAQMYLKMYLKMHVEAA